MDEPYTLQEIQDMMNFVDKFPKTADDVRVYPGMTVWLEGDDSQHFVHAIYEDRFSILVFNRGRIELDSNIDKFYSTHEAALEALK